MKGSGGHSVAVFRGVKEGTTAAMIKINVTAPVAIILSNNQCYIFDLNIIHQVYTIPFVGSKTRYLCQRADTTIGPMDHSLYHHSRYGYQY